jgi:hypothetical protein
LPAKLSIRAVVVLSLAPWAATVFATAGSVAALHLCLYAALVTLVGHGVVSVALPPAGRSGLFIVSPAAGILLVSALTAFWVRAGQPLPWAAALWLGLGAFGVAAFCRGRDPGWRQAVDHGPALVLISFLVCVIYFLPGAWRDGVSKSDGSFNWMYVDTQYFQSMAASLKNSSGTPKMPGMSTEELYYHFGGYAPAAAISRFTGLKLADAYARVARGTSLWALVLSSYGLGTLLAFRATGKSYGGIFCTAGLFFYGSLMSLFSNASNSASTVSGAILFRLPEVEVLADGGPFSHLMLGHSVLNGLIAITATLGLCLAQRVAEPEGAWRIYFCAALPALAVSMDSPAALYCLGAAGILLVWPHFRQPRSWALMLLLAGLFFAAWKLMGYDRSPMAAAVTFKRNFYTQWWMLVVWFTVGLGFRTLGFRWIGQPWTDPLPALVAATAAGFLSFSLFCGLYWGNERYGIYFLQCMLGFFAFSRLVPGWWREPALAQWAREWAGVVLKGLVALSAGGAAMATLFYAIHRHSGISFFTAKLFTCLLATALLAGFSALVRQTERLAAIGSKIALVVLMVGFLGWISPWINFGLGRMRLDVTVKPGEVAGLERLKALSVPGERFATNKHAVENPMTKPERSYAYGALSERPVLLEGWWLGAETALPEYKSILADNDLLFSTTNPAALRRIAGKYQIVFLVARPGTDLALPRPLPSWLKEESNCGDLKIYRIQ